MSESGQTLAVLRRTMQTMLRPTPILQTATDSDLHYRALQSRDARFDGQFFTGVTSTGVYCRPVCRVRTPKQENCRFFRLAAQAEQAGFRPCLRCRPELAPLASPSWADPAWSTQDASTLLARQAARLLDTPEAWPDAPARVDSLTRKLGISGRHLRRIFQAEWGVTPMQYLQTRRLLCAKQLLTDTDLSAHQVAALSGFSSVRRFNDAFVSHYQLQPTALRRKQTSKSPGTEADTCTTLRCTYRPPYAVDAMLQFFAQRAVPGLECVLPEQRVLRRTLRCTAGARTYMGWVQAQFLVDKHEVELRISEALTPMLPSVLARVRHWLDLDADAPRIEDALGAAFVDATGMRVPGTLDGFELAVRAILGQQVTVAAARTYAQRLVEHVGGYTQTPWPDLCRVFPDAHTLAQVAPESLGELGIVRQRQRAILTLAAEVASDRLHLHPGADVPSTMAALQALPGIGAWTAQYIAMRALHWPDAFPGGDVALQSALGVRDSAQPAHRAQSLSQVWRPWRSYAVMRLWAGKLRPVNPTPMQNPSL